MNVKQMIDALSKLDPKAILLHDLQDGQPPVYGVHSWYRTHGVVYASKKEAIEAGGNVESVVLVR